MMHASIPPDRRVMFSIIVPVHSTEAFLPACIDSILAQTDPDFELLLVDDGSTDRSLEICRERAEGDARVRLVSLEQSGVSAARNAGLAAATGEWITFVDSDDTVSPSALACARLACAEPGCDLAIFSIRRLDLTGPVPAEQIWRLEDRVYADCRAFLDEMLAGRALLTYSNANKFYRAARIRERGLRFIHGMAFGEDRWFNFDYLTECGVIVTRSEAIYHYHQRARDSLSRVYRPDAGAEAARLHRRKRELLLASGFPNGRIAAFLVSDLEAELKQSLKHAARHWRALSREERRGLAERFAAVDWPDYLAEVRGNSAPARLALWAVRSRRPWLVRALFGIAGAVGSVA